ncbi:MAG: RsmB/NOP family class I SAM-dependent RNA methyltransferase [Duncaniella sp.]|nr:RsmB/NOP family class I SAM-dependent RNA methyltransferase [Muribaculum sp.]MCM1255079.1 RsmB/NOP family class I SAM-dependent RNA methyltransferase [Duncaniella sp.]
MNRELPAKFVEMLTRLCLTNLPDTLSEGSPEVSVRFNRAKNTSNHFQEADGEVPWCESGFYLKERPRFTLDPAFHQGRYYVQEASSMFHGYVVKNLVVDKQPLTILDACAAPGGKTTAVIDSLPAGSLVVANEYVPSRASILRENAIKWGFPGIVVTRADTHDFGKLCESFDIVIADVPCSGEGMMRKDDEAVAQWSEELIEECAVRQWEIVGNLWETLRPGGYMIYSTCTFNRRENEEMVGRIINELGGESVEIHVDNSWGITPGIDTPHHCYRFIPGRTRGEGLFVSVIRKDGQSSPSKLKNKVRKSDNKKPAFKLPPHLSEWLKNSEEMEIYCDNDRVTAFPKQYMPILNALKQRVDVIHEGILLGNIKGKDIVPSQSLAMSQVINTHSFTICEINKYDALHYLHGDAIVLPEGTERGFVLLTYDDMPLGFVKNLGNRSNNLYPTSWRIRKSIDN